MLCFFKSIWGPSFETVFHLERLVSALHWKWGELSFTAEPLAQTCPFRLCGFGSAWVSLEAKFSLQRGSISIPPTHQCPDTTWGHFHNCEFPTPLLCGQGVISNKLVLESFGLSFLYYEGLHALNHRVQPYVNIRPLILNLDQAWDILIFLPNKT